MRPPAYPLSVNDEIELHGHRWIVKGIHLGALGQESLIHLESLSHTPGWTGPWEFHPMLFVPEIMLSAALSSPSLASAEGAGVDRDDLRSIIHTATHHVLPFADVPMKPFSIKERAAMQVEIADMIILALFSTPSTTEKEG